MYKHTYTSWWYFYVLIRKKKKKVDAQTQLQYIEHASCVTFLHLVRSNHTWCKHLSTHPSLQYRKENKKNSKKITYVNASPSSSCLWCMVFRLLLLSSDCRKNHFKIFTSRIVWEFPLGCKQSGVKNEYYFLDSSNANEVVRTNATFFPVG